MFNHLQSKPEFRKEVERQIVLNDIEKRLALRECKRTLTLEKLIECRKKFQKYIKTYGDKEPVKTRFELLNSIANNALSYSHYIHTNQPYAKRILDIIDEAKSNNKDHETIAVNNALKKIKDVHTKMFEKRIYGEVRTNIEDTIKKFNYDIENTVFNEQQKKIIQILNYIGELDDDSRINTPRWLR